jgi:hypothetical protein
LRRHGRICELASVFVCGQQGYFADRIHFDTGKLDASNSFFISAAFSIWPVAS